ncbi:MAG: DegT/DnrJ/EryC1/StrS family aminotransferase [Chloroflexi bacterium]|nr:DegT/DnrJ/EryC1/StrS family aminotransferase [Chloroflexota bacterium]
MDHSIPVFTPFHGEEEIAAVAEVIRSGWWGLGPKTAEFEKRFAEYVAAPYAVSANSATAALHLALLVAGAEGGEVITTPMTFVSTNHAILYNRATPIFADVEPDTLNIDPDDIERKITSNTRALLVVHYGGHPCDLDRIHELARQHNLIVIEDAAHAAGARYHDRPIGALSPMTCFSFHPVKNLATGDGGMITLENEEWDARLRRVRWVGINRDTWVRASGDAAQYAWQYDVEELGYKYHSNDIMSAIALVQLGRLNDTNARRRAISARYDDGLRDLEWLQLPVEREGVYSSRHNYVVRCDRRDDLGNWLRQHRVATGMHYIPNHLHAMYREYAREPLPVVEREWLRLLTLPLYPGLSDQDVDYIIQVIRAFPA